MYPSDSLIVRTAERPGSLDRPSEDRIFTTPNAVIVLDGATQAIPLERDGGWIADELGRRLVAALTTDPGGELVPMLERCIAAMVKDHDLRPETAPSTTVSIVRRDGDALDVLVLCDSPVIVLDTTGQIHEIRDDRLTDVIARIRPRGSLQSLPADERMALIAQFEAHRNQPHGFWCVTATPEAARHAIVTSFAVAQVDTVLTMTDGVAAGVIDYGMPADWLTAFAVARDHPQQLVDLVHEVEASDPDCSRWPRSKRHDDKVAARITPA
ncbi:MAG: protein phosphatase 2C domain-containing protein [Acidimicrobiales bacterium]